MSISFINKKKALLVVLKQLKKTMDNTRHFDWSENWNKETGEEKMYNIGRDLILDKCKCEKSARDYGYCEKCEISEDSNTPMMNYIYPLNNDSYNDDLIIKVCEETNLTVVKDNATDELYLTLCGGGMDLSQDIAKAYFILSGDSKYNKVPVDMLRSMCLQPELSINLKDFIKITRYGKLELKNEIKHLQWKLKEYKDANKKAREMFKSRNVKK